MIAVSYVMRERAGPEYFWQVTVSLAEAGNISWRNSKVKAMEEASGGSGEFYGSIRQVRHDEEPDMANIKGLQEAGEVWGK